jgi:tripartite-type tricarboxylate transporter receptor subunit TctC
VLTPQTIVVGAQTPYKSMKDLVAAAKAKPGDIAYASLGNGSTSHLTMEAFQSAAGIRMNHIPFKGSSDAQTQIIGGQVPLMSDTVSGVLAQVKAGKLRAIGVAIPQRSPYLPDVPTIAEQGYPGFESWAGSASPPRRARRLRSSTSSTRSCGRSTRTRRCARSSSSSRSRPSPIRARSSARGSGRDREVEEGREGQRREG